MHAADLAAPFHLRAERQQPVEADAMVDRIVRPDTPAAKLDDGKSHAPRIAGDEIAAINGPDRTDDRGWRQIAIRFFHDVRRPAEGMHHAAEGFGRRTAG